MDDADELAYWLALRRAGLGTTSFALLIAKFGSVAAAWEAPAEALRAAGIDQQYVRRVVQVRAGFAPGRELAALERAGARAVTWGDAAYPARLREIPQSPPVLFIRGSAGPEFEQAVAVVGTRNVTPYGRQVAEAFCEALAELGVAIIRSRTGWRWNVGRRRWRSSRVGSTRCTPGSTRGWRSGSWSTAAW